jgi:hypothetical protein
MRLGLIALLVTGCSGATMKPTTLPSCTTHEECHAHDGQRVEVVGIYTVWEPRADISPEQSKSRVVKLRFDGAKSGPFLAKAHKRSPEEIAQFRGKRVRVIGTYVRQMPQRPQTEAQLQGASIDDVESITLDE